MILLGELLEDKTFRKFFEKQPALPAISRTIPPYRLWVQREARGKWLRKNTGSYQSGVRWFLEHIDEIHDGALAIPSTQSPPPRRLVKIKGKTFKGADGVVRPVVKEVPWVFHPPQGEREHHWCPYCRRPTVFTWFSKHHNQPHVLQPEYARCTICGLREDSIPKAWR